MTSLTLTYGATTQSLEAWGFSNPRFYPRSRGIGVFTVDLPGADPAASPSSVIPFGAPVKISGTFAGMNGGSPVVIFQGTRRQWSGRAHPEARSTNLVFCDAVWDLQNTPFQHYWQFKNPGATSFTTEYFSRINLFQNISAGPTNPWTYFTVKQQLQEIITYASINCGIAVNYGVIDPTQVFNLMPCKAVSCWDAIMKCLQLLPDVMTQMDYTTTPPTLNFYQRTGSAGVVTLPYSGTDANGRMHKSSDLKDHPDLVPSQVVIQYQQTNTVDSANTNYWFSDVYPALSTGAAVQALVVPIDLTGSTLTTLSKTVNAEAFDPTNLAFWKKYKHELNDTNQITGLALVSATVGTGINDITVNDESGTPINLSNFPNILLPGDSVSSWMYDSVGINAVKAVVKGVLSYGRQQQINATGPVFLGTDKVANHETIVRLTLTNSPVGAETYTTVTKYIQGEAAPTGLAQYWYNALRPVQWEGTHTIVEDTIYEIIDEGNVLNLTGSGLTNQQSTPAPTFNSAWSTMAATITDVEIDFFHGTTKITFGPHKHVSLNEYFALLEAWRWRAIYQNLNTRNTGVSGGGDALDGSGLSTRENTTEQTPLLNIQTIVSPPDGSGSQVIIQHDTTTNGGQIVSNTTKDDGTVDATLPQVALALSDLGGANIAKWRTATLPTGSTVGGSPGTSVKFAGSADITIAGGGGGGTPCSFVKSYHFYWLCSPVGGGAHIRVAKPNNIQPVSSETILGSTFSYGYGLTTTTGYPASFTRSSTCTASNVGANVGFVENQALFPMPQSGWLLIAVGGVPTGLSVESQDVTDNPGDGVTTSTPITYLDTGNWGCEFYAPDDQTPIDW